MCYISSNVAEGKEEGEERLIFQITTMERNVCLHVFARRAPTESIKINHFQYHRIQQKIVLLFFFSVLPSRLYRCPLKTGFPFNIFKCQYCAQIIFNLAAESIPVNRYEWLQFFFPFQQLTILTCKEESFCKILNFYKGKNWQNNNNICLLSGNIDMVLLQQNWFVLWSVSHR